MDFKSVIGLKPLFLSNGSPMNCIFGFRVEFLAYGKTTGFSGRERWSDILTLIHWLEPPHFYRGDPR